MHDFERAVRDYAALHQRVARKVSAVESSSDAGQIHDAVNTLGRAIRAARPTATVGNIFGPDMAAAFRQRIRQSLAASGYTTKELLAEINDETEPSAPRPVVVNHPFPWERASMMLPSLLAVLPPLPRILQYRFVDRDFVLVDIDADLVVDVLSAVLIGGE